MRHGLQISPSSRCLLVSPLCTHVVRDYFSRAIVAQVFHKQSRLYSGGVVRLVRGIAFSPDSDISGDLLSRKPHRTFIKLITTRSRF